MAATNKLDRCISGSHGVCAWRTNIVDFMSRLNKTRMDDDEILYKSLGEDSGAYRGFNMKDQGRAHVGPVFMYELSQLKEENGGISDAFRKDLADFLDLDGELPPIPHISTAGVLDFIPGVKELSESLVIDICDEEHSYIRSILLKKAQSASEWITKYFIKSNDVRVSSEQYFVKRLKGWKVDPCITRRNMA